MITFLYVWLFVVCVVVIINKLTSFRCKSHVCLVGKTALVTGGASGIGSEVALALAARGCRVLIADVIDTSTIVQEIITQTHNPNVVGKTLDLASFQSVRDLAADIVRTESRLDILVNNAGIANMNISYTDDGVERTLQINYFAHFLLTHLLIDLMKKSAPTRIIFTSSLLAYYACENLKPETNFDNFGTALRGGTYGVSKLCMAGASKTFAEKLKGSGVTSNCYQPGAAKTKIFYKCLRYVLLDFLPVGLGLIVWLFGKTPEEAAQTAVYLAVADEVEGVTGKFFADGHECLDPLQLRDSQFSEELWKKSVIYTKLEEEELKI